MSIMAITFLACKRIHNNQGIENKELPKALQEKKLSLGDVSSARYNNDLVDDLYGGLVKERPDLKDIENSIDHNQVKKDEITGLFQVFDGKNESYYNSANTQVQSISDTILRARLISIIKASNDRYKNRSKNIETLIKQIEARNISIKDYHTAMKLIITLPLIEDYQKESIPHDSIYKGLYKMQGILIKKIDQIKK